MRELLLTVLKCPACGAAPLSSRADMTVACSTCGRAHAFKDEILHIAAIDEHPEVTQERAAVRTTEGAPELGGWRETVYAPAIDPDSALGQAYLSLPYGNGAPYFEEPGYFRNVRHFAPEFELVRRRLPHEGLLLDLGADGTWSTARLARHGLTCIAVDITDHLRLARLYQTKSPPYALVNVDMHAPIFVDGAFDAVTAFNAMHHSKRLDELIANVSRVLKPGGLLGFVEPYIQNARQEADFGAPQTAAGINENVHSLDRWHHALVTAGLMPRLVALTDAFTAVYQKIPAGKRAGPHPPLLETFYHSRLTVVPTAATGAARQPLRFRVRIVSVGNGAWASRGPTSIGLSYHVSRVTASGPAMQVFDNPRTPLLAFVDSNQPATVDIDVQLDEPGLYEVEFDLVHETRTWFADAGGRPCAARVEIV